MAALPKHILNGYRVLDMTHVLAGPTATRLMVEMGAEVVQSFDEPEGRWISMKDPEGNEFCLEG